VDWAAGCVLVYASLFGVGKLVFGETELGLAILALAAGAGWLIYRDLDRRGWRAVVE
jgi:SSS family solute:Na+ symporter